MVGESVISNVHAVKLTKKYHAMNRIKTLPSIFCQLALKAMTQTILGDVAAILKLDEEIGKSQICSS